MQLSGVSPTAGPAPTPAGVSGRRAPVIDGPGDTHDQPPNDRPPEAGVLQGELIRRARGPSLDAVEQAIAAATVRFNPRPAQPGEQASRYGADQALRAYTGQARDPYVHIVQQGGIVDVLV